jgi:hypothetical protein
MEATRDYLAVLGRGEKAASSSLATGAADTISEIACA